ncbi:MAG: TIGR01841 family phasin [Paracraurococcus sp.]
MSEPRFALPMPALPNGAMFSALMAIQVKNLEALAAAQRAAIEGMGTLAKQQQAMLTAKLQGSAGLPSTLSVGTDPQEAIARPFDAMKSAILDNQAQSNLLNELAAQAGAGVANILQARFLASLDEMKAALLLAVPTRD